MKALIYLANTGLLALAIYPLFCLYYYEAVSWTGFRLFVAVLLMAFSLLLLLLGILRLKSLPLDAGVRLAFWLLALGWSVVCGVFIVVKLMGWGEFSEAFLFALPGMISLGLSALIRYPQFRRL